MTQNKFKINPTKNDYINWLLSIFVIFGLMYELIIFKWHFGLMVQTVIVPFIFYTLNKTRKKLFYSFWTFVVISSIFLLRKIYVFDNDTYAFYFYLISLMLLFILSYSLWNPIFYPIINWWEYDFRYRYDLVININRVNNDKSIAGRLTDLRRTAGSISSFESFNVGETLLIAPFEDIKDFTFEVEIKSKHQFLIGRPTIYGIKFNIKDDYTIKLYKRFSLYWRQQRAEKKLSKYEK